MLKKLGRKRKGDYQRTDRYTTIIRTERCKDIFGQRSPRDSRQEREQSDHKRRFR